MHLAVVHMASSDIVQRILEHYCLISPNEWVPRYLLLLFSVIVRVIVGVGVRVRVRVRVVEGGAHSRGV